MKRILLVFLVACFFVSTVSSIDPPGTKVPLGLVVGSGKTKTVIDSTEIKSLNGVTGSIQTQLDGTVKSADLLNYTSYIYSKAQVDSIAKFRNSTIGLLKEYGSTAKTTTAIFHMVYVNTQAQLTDNSVVLVALTRMPFAYTATSIRFMTSAAFVGTADNNNRIGLYKLVGTTYTLVASIPNDANLWTTAANTVVTKTWTTPYSVPANEQLYAGFLYNQSAVSTVPALSGTSAAQTNFFINTFTGTTTHLVAINGGENDLPETFETSATTRNPAAPFCLIF
jgi:hypothetical protein